jgi:pantothenate kinase
MSSVEELAAAIVDRAQHSRRYLTALAGPPGSGKSTWSEALAAALPPDETVIVQADGFHFDNALLDRLGRREHKGAPDTFDCRGIEILLRRIRGIEPDVVAPVFDRALDVARAGAIMIGQNVRYVLVEGNYLALHSGPWSMLRQHFDCTIFIDVPRRELQRRLMSRWLDLGFSADVARRKVEGNDLRNADLVLSQSRDRDLTWRPCDPS